ncbi:MAG: YggS family pyridoxal phosphate-dependent enzyme [Clostridiales bacterium]|nr:YggS family pyridoxal phosphate-dependent enzyme [Clostridiales bacterium]
MTENLSIDPRRLRDVEESWKRIRHRVEEAALRAGRSPEDVRLMAVTKTVEAPYINRAIACGADLIGENRVQEYLSKRDKLDLDHCEKHLIGHLQTNKVRQIVGEVDMIQSVGSLKLAQEIEKQSAKLDCVTPVLLEVNIGGEQSKSGFAPQAVLDALCQVSQMSHVRVQGLMTIPPICETSREVRKYFSQMYESFIDIQGKKIDNVNMNVLSMGMSGDFEDAIAEGSTLVRVGSAIFGARTGR